MARQRETQQRLVAPHALIEGALQLLAYGLRSSGILVEQDVARNLPELLCDPDQMQRVLINLLVNARQALEDQPQPRRVTIAARADGETIRDGFARLAPRLDCVSLAFCSRLFELDLSLRALFPNDLHPLAACLATGLEIVVRSLDDLRPVLMRAPALGLRLASYGLQPTDLPTIGAAFLATLDAELGDALTNEARAAWLRIFWTIAIATIGADSRALAAA